MAEYFIAQWDYAAEGNYELSFKEGDKIKLLEKHNDDWWEGELNDEIGFFPANRTMAMIEHIKSNFDLQKSAINPYLKPKLPDRPKMDLLVDTTLPDGWSSFYDSTGTIYFSNHSTGESQWERPLPNKDLTFDIKNSKSG